ncbi:hypothetical protein [Persicobacter sp. CCB-QB2]|uniref:hypothetical protein n=1 Tax=Persicobacter sp. CCB-QB2 TaxID=1561025 RepID=UPI0006A9D5D8|nr:hypothetical protein [Persicobacter sp. CCB-QB2]
MNDKQKKYFEAHPTVKKFYFTSDGMAFQRENPAIQHQKNIDKKKEIQTVKRPQEAKGLTAAQKGQQTKLTKKLEELRASLLDAPGQQERDAIQEQINETEQKLENLQ